MTKNYSLGAFAILIGILSALVWYRTGSPLPPSGENEIWYHAGLFTLLIGTYVVEYRFTRPNDVFVNCLVVFASTSTLTDPPNATWWQLLRWSALAFGILAMLLAWDPGQESKLASSRVRTIIYQVVTRLGSAEVLFSFVFLLALLSYFNLASVDAKIFVIAWAAFLIAAHLNLSELGRIAFRPGKFRDRKVLAVTHSFLAPSIVYCRMVGRDKAALHQLVGFCQSSDADCHCFGVVIGERSSATENRVVVALLNTTIPESRLNDRSIVVTTTEFDAEAIDKISTQAERESLKGIVGTIAKGTNISRIRFELLGNPALGAGSLLSVRSGERSVYYQVFDAVIDEEHSIKDSTRAFVEGEAEQVGIWDEGRGGFDTHDWVAKERSQVRLIGLDNATPAYELKPTEMKLGQVPNSNFPVNIDVNNLVLYHSGILGVTGSGKSYLTFGIIEECAKKGIKSICIDPTGDYQRHLQDAVLLSGSQAINAFLNSPDHKVGIIETASNSSVHAIDQALKASQVCLEWCRRNRQEDEILDPKPKVMVVLEEAHLLIPEWNFNPVASLRDHVSAHSQIVLQARKYGLGFLVVSQRTANVVKSILNQCNTIISFQAFDETGFEFLKHYMGTFHVNSLPNLKARHGLLVGKASLSRRPLMVRFNDQERALRQDPAPAMPLPPPAPVVEETPV